MDPHVDIGTVLLVLFGMLVAALVAIVVAWRRFRRWQTSYRPSRYSPVVSMHVLAAPSVFETGRDRVRRKIRTTPTSEGRADAAFRLQVQLAEYELALSEPPEPIRGHLAEAARLGVARLPHVDLDAGLEVLPYVIAFGTPRERLDACSGWRTRQVKDDEPESRAALADGLVALSQGDSGAARPDLVYAAANEERWMFVAIASAAIALIDHEHTLFERHIVASLHEHQKEYRGLPDNPSGLMNVFALAICRLAIEAGLVVEERPYLPIRLLPAGSP